jgi:hypothetical protein
MSKERKCLNCKWSRWNAPHLGCYYNYEWQTWIPQKMAKVFAFCEIPEGEYLKFRGTKWEGKEKKLNKCCLEILNLIKYRDTPEIVKGYELKVEIESGDLHYCSLCGKVLGSCSVCDTDYGTPLMLFLNKGEKGAIILCVDCFNKLGLGLKIME